MDFLKSGLKSVLGSPQPGDQPTGAETVCVSLYSFVLCHFELNTFATKMH